MEFGHSPDRARDVVLRDFHLIYTKTQIVLLRLARSNVLGAEVRAESPSALMPPRGFLLLFMI